MRIDEKDLLEYKISLAKDLKKRIKSGYKNQFRNILIKITSKPKRYKKAKSNVNVSEDIIALENMHKSIYSYLMDMFNVFGDNAMLNAKRIFEDSGLKWGKKFHKSFGTKYDSKDVKKLVAELYISIKDIDYIVPSDNELKWIFRKPGESSGLSRESNRYCSILYEIKSIWLQSFIKTLAPGMYSVLETHEENDDQIVTSITIKEG